MAVAHGMNTQIQHAGIAIVGGGPVGALAALLLASAGHRVVLLEARQQGTPVHDARALALSWASRLHLQSVGAWPDDLPASVIDTVHVSQQGRWGRTVIHAEDSGLPHLGHVVDYPLLSAALERQLIAAGVQVQWGTRVVKLQRLGAYVVLDYQNAKGSGSLTTRLAVLADGGALLEQLPGCRTRQYDYRQSAVLAQVRTAEAARGVAYERFSRFGPLAMLPHGDGFTLVWICSPAEAEALCQLDEAARCQALQQAFGERQGLILSMSAPVSYPLRMRQVRQVVQGRVLLIGNAAQALHPVAGQGLNLGIRDAVALAAAVGCEGDPGDAARLAAYAGARRRDSRAVVGFTHGLIQVFASGLPLSGMVRGLGMNMLDLLPPLRRRFAEHLVFGLEGRV